MLVLIRNTGESIKVGDDITIVVLENDGHQVRIGIDAPKNVAVHRMRFITGYRRKGLLLR